MSAHQAGVSGREAEVGHQPVHAPHVVEAAAARVEPLVALREASIFVRGLLNHTCTCTKTIAKFNASTGIRASFLPLSQRHSSFITTFVHHIIPSFLPSNHNAKIKP